MNVPRPMARASMCGEMSVTRSFESSWLRRSRQLCWSRVCKRLVGVDWGNEYVRPLSQHMPLRIKYVPYHISGYKSKY